jgi:hypothetical protein
MRVQRYGRPQCRAIPRLWYFVCYPAGAAGFNEVGYVFSSDYIVSAWTSGTTKFPLFAKIPQTWYFAGGSKPLPLHSKTINVIYYELCIFYQ